jgi:23S rRNA (cytosine1962-C5)-methyltransferase
MIQDVKMLETAGWDAYALLDSGEGRKLERYGSVVVDRPDAQAIWKRTSPALWDDAQAIFSADKDEEGSGRWKRAPGLEDAWTMSFQDVRFICRFSAFRHVGVFPEQAAHWAWFAERIRSAATAGRKLKILNLFGYTGIASLVAAASGAEVTHVDASKKAIAWARENQALSGLENKPIRWICDDAAKFVARETRRGNVYDGIILDPPKYGRGPKGEVWQVMESLPGLMDDCREILSPKADFMILTAYAIRASFFMAHEMMRDRISDMGGTLTSGELVLTEQISETADAQAARRLSTSMYSRWEA